MTEVAEVEAAVLENEFELPGSWREVLAGETEQPYFAQLAEFVAAERAEHQVFPPRGQVFSALAATAYRDVRVLVLGQDPYHDDGQAHGMSFSVLPGTKTPPSLRNIFKELHADLELPVPDNGYLMPWAEQGVLLLNAVLTVRAHEANSHKAKGWEKFTDAVIKAVSAREEPCVFVLWGNYAKKKLPLIDTSRHVVVQGAHPSPLSAKLFFGSRPFSQINEALAGFGGEPVDWRIPDLAGN
ncbi:uracil-DNA glycosylase [Kitasatospora viridis]|uniref:Uracil-DNA glycosylase n=1 Tax=Kitasatospora viridis TaxID=281105 RepID=A0A561UKE6_9ACTN|nr:uracil-DNA glycosylase [Kitasatospora viridis]